VQQTQATPEGGTGASASKGVLSPKLGVLFHLPRMGDLFVNLSRGFRQTDGVITDPTLPFITAWAYETGIKLNGQYASGSIGVFRMDVSNEQTFNPITAQSTSGGASRRQGVEVELTARPEPALQLHTEWTFNDAKYRHLVTEEGDALDGARVFNTATYLGTAALEVAPLGAIWRLRLSSNVLGRYTPFDEPGVQLPAYALFHAAGSVRLGNATLDLGVRNVLNRAYPEVRAGGFVAPGQPRTVFGSLRWHR
jgi:iron complex outermembrane receptor protein